EGRKSWFAKNDSLARRKKKYNIKTDEFRICSGGRFQIEKRFSAQSKINHRRRWRFWRSGSGKLRHKIKDSCTKQCYSEINNEKTSLDFTYLHRGISSPDSSMAHARLSPHG